MERLSMKRDILTGYLEFIIWNIDISEQQDTDKSPEIFTPSDPKQRGSRISFVAHGPGKYLYGELVARGVVLDWREPNIISLAPVPLYISYMDVF